MYKCLGFFNLSINILDLIFFILHLFDNKSEFTVYISFIVHEMSKKDYDFIFFPSNIPTFIQDFARYFTSKTIITEQTRNCLPSVNNPEATALEVISDGRRIVKENRSQFQLQKVASMSIAIFKELRWRLSVIFFDNLYGKKIRNAADEFYWTIGKKIYLYSSLSFIGNIIFMFSKPLCFYLNQSILF